MSKSLGRGLSSLIPPKVNKKDKSSKGLDLSLDQQKELRDIDSKDRILNIDPALIVMNPYQPRSNFSEISLNELKESIANYGILQPLVVSKKGRAYELIAGERRLRSARALDFETVPVIVREVDDQRKFELALIENLQREDLDPIELARAYSRLMNEFSLSQEEVAKRSGKARSSVANTLRYLDLAEEIQEALSSARISESHAKYLLGISNPNQRLVLFRKILRQNLSVSETRDEIKRLGGTKSAQILSNHKDLEYEAKFREYFGTKARIQRLRKGGRVVLDFYSDEELLALIKKIKD